MPNMKKFRTLLEMVPHSQSTRVLQQPQQILSRKQSVVKHIQSRGTDSFSLSQCNKQEDLYDVQTLPVQFDRQMFDSIVNELNDTVNLDVVLNDLQQGDTTFVITKIKESNHQLKKLVRRINQLEQGYHPIHEKIQKLCESHSFLMSTIFL
ncbi:Hypothetical_protein [Hexamita inflata]|uniref:Hypothetical_protein n=1 Tax=Hexamita inflata TaxID=28002 RepID=A0AA86QAJ9_9EUKA|nr:Hypothetical protein HINF_LOCUS43234 [Hexamita inflata]